MRKRILQNIKKCGSLLLIKTFNTIFLRDLKEGLHQDTKTWFTVSFFLLCLLVFPLAVGAIEDVLEKIAVAAIWISALFANLLALENLENSNSKLKGKKSCFKGGKTKIFGAKYLK